MLATQKYHLILRHKETVLQRPGRGDRTGGKPLALLCNFTLSTPLVFSPTQIFLSNLIQLPRVPPEDAGQRIPCWFLIKVFSLRSREGRYSLKLDLV